MTATARDVAGEIRKLAQERILVLDGAWGVLLQNRGLNESDFRGERFAAHPRDLLNDPDLLNLTQPEIVRSVHDAYFAAGADITTTNTFTATSIGQADYGLEDAVYELNVAGARIAREAAGPDRFVAGSVGPLNITLSLSPRVDDPGYRTHTFDQVVETYAEQIRGLADGGADLLLIETIFDTLNAKAALLAAREVAPATAALDQRHDRRPLGPNAQRTDDRRLLDVDRARRPVDRRSQLRARRARDAAVRRRALAHRVLPHLRTSECRAAERLRRLRRDTRRDVRTAARVCAGRLPEHRRQLLRLDAGAHEGDRRGCARAGAAPGAAAAAIAAVQRPGAVRDRRGHRLRPDRRAHQCDRIGALSPPDRSRRLQRGCRCRARAGARGREPDRREHGCGPPRGRAGDAHLPQRDRHGARGCASARDDRQLEVDGARGGPAMPPGEGHRQLDLAEGGGGGIPAPGPADPGLRGGRRRHGVRRAGTGDRGRASRRDLRACLRPARERRRLPTRGHRLRSERPGGRDRDRRAQRLRPCLPRGSPEDQGALPRRAHLGRHLEPQLLVPGQRRRPRGDACGVPLPRDPGGARHGHRQRRAARGLRGHRAGAQGASRGRALQPSSGRHRAPGRDRRPVPRGGHEA